MVVAIFGLNWFKLEYKNSEIPELKGKIYGLYFTLLNNSLEQFIFKILGRSDGNYFDHPASLK